jgi:hypothetical protein
MNETHHPPPTATTTHLRCTATTCLSSVLAHVVLVCTWPALLLTKTTRKKKTKNQTKVRAGEGQIKVFKYSSQQLLLQSNSLLGCTPSNYSRQNSSVLSLLGKQCRALFGQL